MTYIKPYLRIMQDCAYDTNKDCSVSGKIKLLNGTVWGEDFTTYYRLILDDGTVMFVRTNSVSEDNTCAEMSPSPNVCGVVLYDINGIKKPNIVGKDIFHFFVIPTGAIPVNYDDCYKNKAGWSCANYILAHENMKYPN